MPNQRPAIIILAVAAAGFTLSCFLFTPARGPLKFSPAVLPDAQLGVPYEATITISGNATPAGQFSLSEGVLPNGLTLEKVEGADSVLLRGTPQAAGTFKFKVFVWCYGTNVSGQDGEQEYSLTVK